MIWYLVFLVAAANSATGRRIVGGEETTIENHPGVVQLEQFGTNLWSPICGANIVNEYFVVTAAHCVTSVFIPKLQRIRAGTTYRGSGGSIHDVLVSFRHPQYGVISIGNNYDVALMRLYERLEFSSSIGPVALPAQGSEVPDGAGVVTAGWGTTSEGGEVSEVLQHVTVYTINHDECKEIYANLVPPSTVTDDMICAGISDVGGKDSCQGDSGGPLYYKGFLHGLVSWGNGCARPGYPGVYTKVSAHSDWIATNSVY